MQTFNRLFDYVQYYIYISQWLYSWHSVSNKGVSYHDWVQYILDLAYVRLDVIGM